MVALQLQLLAKPYLAYKIDSSGMRLRLRPVS